MSDIVVKKHNKKGTHRREERRYREMLRASRCVSIDRVIKIDGCPDEYQPREASAELSRDGLARCKRD